MLSLVSKLLGYVDDCIFQEHRVALRHLTHMNPEPRYFVLPVDVTIQSDRRKLKQRKSIKSNVLVSKTTSDYFSSIEI